MNLEALKLYFGAGNLKSEKLISDSYKFIWVGIPKVAMTSILSVLHRDAKQDYGTYETHDDLNDIVKNKNYKNYFKFAFVRNPWARVVSCYLNKIVKGQIKDRDFLDNYIGLKSDMSFEDFVNFLTIGRGRFDFLSDRHWMSQHKFLIDKSGKILVDYIGKLENIDSDFMKVCKKIGLPNIELPKYNTRFDWGVDIKNNEAGPSYYRSYYTDKTRKLISRRYKKDISLFNYEF
jgi:chondroitin 4-sulfotransferase 11